MQHDYEVPFWKCEHCGRSLADKRGLISHKRKQPKCRRKELEMKESRIQQSADDSTQNDEIPEILPNDSPPVTTTQYQPFTQQDVGTFEQTGFNDGFEFYKLIRGFGGGTGLSQKDVTSLIKFLKNPLFNAKRLPYSNGRAATEWFRKYIGEGHGGFQVIMCGFFFPQG